MTWKGVVLGELSNGRDRTGGHEGGTEVESV